MKNSLRWIALSALLTGAAPLAAEDAEKGVVVTSEDLSQRCIMALVVTAVDGTEVDDTDAAGRFEFEPGVHSISGYAGGDPSQCETFAAEGGVALAEGQRIGESTLKLDVEAGKEYYLGVDTRSKDQSRWKIVAWKINH